MQEKQIVAELCTNAFRISRLLRNKEAIPSRGAPVIVFFANKAYLCHLFKSATLYDCWYSAAQCCK